MKPGEGIKKELRAAGIYTEKASDLASDSDSSISDSESEDDDSDVEDTASTGTKKTVKSPAAKKPAVKKAPVKKTPVKKTAGSKKPTTSSVKSTKPPRPTTKEPIKKEPEVEPEPTPEPVASCTQNKKPATTITTNRIPPSPTYSTSTATMPNSPMRPMPDKDVDPAAKKVEEQLMLLENPEMEWTENGSEDYPYLHMVNTRRPEANKLFCICYIPQMEWRNYKRNVYFIRLPASPCEDTSQYEAFIPVDKYQHFKGRCVMIRIPSQSWFHQKAALYHQNQSFCVPTFNAHESLETAIANEPSRKFVYWLLVFPPGTQLENHILSDDGVHVKKGVEDLDDTVKEEGEEDDTPVYATDIYWRIALAGGNMLRSPDRANGRSLAGRRRNRTAGARPDEDNQPPPGPQGSSQNSKEEKKSSGWGRY